MDAGTPLPRYVCHKRVGAAPIVAVDGFLAQLTIELPDGTREMRHGRPGMFSDRLPEVGDFFVEYDDGYTSVSPRGPFLAGYVPDVSPITFQPRHAELPDPGGVPAP